MNLIYSGIMEKSSEWGKGSCLLPQQTVPTICKMRRCSPIHPRQPAGEEPRRAAGVSLRQGQRPARADGAVQAHFLRLH